MKISVFCSHLVNIFMSFQNVEIQGGYTIYLCNLGKLAKRGGGGYPQALPKVINLQGMLDLPKILVLIEKLPPRS